MEFETAMLFLILFLSGVILFNDFAYKNEIHRIKRENTKRRLEESRQLKDFIEFFDAK